MAKNQTNYSTTRTTNTPDSKTYKCGGFPKASPLGGKLPPAGG